MGQGIDSVVKFFTKHGEKREVSEYKVTENFAEYGENTYRVFNLSAIEEDGEVIVSDIFGDMRENERSVLKHFLVDCLVEEPKIMINGIKLEFSNGSITVNLIK